MGVLAVERFRDLVPAFVLAIFEEGFVVEPGDIGPIPFTHPLASDLLWAINNQQLTPSLMGVLGETCAQFYDGCLVVGLVDYRKQAFSMVAPGAPTGAGRPSISGLSVMGGKSTALQPEMHKILMRPSHRTILHEIEQARLSQEASLEAESRLLVHKLIYLLF